jgi:hypothetical protein
VGVADSVTLTAVTANQRHFVAIVIKSEGHEPQYKYPQLRDNDPHGSATSREDVEGVARNLVTILGPANRFRFYCNEL